MIPAKGDIGWVCPGFEEARARELVQGEAEECACGRRTRARTGRSPAILKDRGVGTGRVGVEERLRFFIYSGVKKEAPAMDFVDAEVDDGRLPHEQVRRRRSP